MKHEGRRMRIFRWIFIGMLWLFGTFPSSAQQYTGMSGLIHVPSADMDDAGTVRIGGHFLNKEFLPDGGFNPLGRGKYHTTNHYLSITPFSWIELGYTCTLQKGLKNSNKDDIGFYHKDRYFSVKIRPLQEAEWWPSIAVGANDPYSWSSNTGTGREEDRPKSLLFSNFYIATTKHFNLKGHSLGMHLAYRHWKRDYNSKWNGPVGGITFQPLFQKSLRFIAEYTGDDVNVGFDWKLWKCLLIQSSLQNGKYFSGGVCFCINLL